MTKVTDWRGVEIEVGQLVLYAAASNSSAHTVQGRVTNINTLTHKVSVKVHYRSGGGSWVRKKTVAVQPSSITVVNELPPAGIPNLATEHARIAEKKLNGEANRATHRLLPLSDRPLRPTVQWGHPQYNKRHQQYNEDFQAYRQEWEAWNKAPCLNCTAHSNELEWAPCGQPFPVRDDDDD